MAVSLSSVKSYLDQKGIKYQDSGRFLKEGGKEHPCYGTRGLWDHQQLIQVAVVRSIYLTFFYWYK